MPIRFQLVVTVTGDADLNLANQWIDIDGDPLQNPPTHDQISDAVEYLKGAVLNQIEGA